MGQKIISECLDATGVANLLGVFIAVGITVLPICQVLYTFFFQNNFLPRAKNSWLNWLTLRIDSTSANQSLGNERVWV